MWFVAGALGQSLLQPGRVLEITRQVEQIGNLISETNRNPNENFFRKNFDIVGTLGNGSFGVVFKVSKKQKQQQPAWLQSLTKSFKKSEETPKPEIFAVKMVPRDPLENLEIKNLSNFLHKNVISYYYAWDEKHTSMTPEDKEYFASKFPPEFLSYSGGSMDSLGTKWIEKFGEDRDLTFILQELCDQGTLEDKIRQWESNPETRSCDDIDSIFCQIVQGMEYLEKRQIAHRDLRPDNIFLVREGNNLIPKVGDFGLARQVEVEMPNTSDTNPSSSNPRRGMRKRYQSPEQFENGLFTHKGDIYALGLIYFVMIHPFKSIKERWGWIWKIMEPDEAITFPSGFEESALEESYLIRRMVSHDMDNRPLASEILQWITNMKPNAMDKGHPRKSVTFGYLKTSIGLVEGAHNPFLNQILNIHKIRIPGQMLLPMFEGTRKVSNWFSGKSPNECDILVEKLIHLYDQLDATSKTRFFREFSRIQVQGQFKDEDQIDFDTLNRMLETAVSVARDGNVVNVRVNEGEEVQPSGSRSWQLPFPFLFK